VYKTHVVQPGEWLTTIAKQYGVEWTEIVRLNAIADPNRIAVGTVLKIPNGGIPGTVQAIPGPAGVALPPPNLNDIAGVSGKWIKVVLSEQRVYAYENGKLLKSVVVSTGLPGTPTVIGDFNVYLKYSSQLMYGPDYYLPGVPYVMYFYQGYGLHGTYWHSNFGTPMSHGCVNLPTPEAKWLWEWAPVGTRVSVVW
jgi:lipoprotein-anchoring transpeptidase ErfK/SrfK